MAVADKFGILLLFFAASAQVFSGRAFFKKYVKTIFFSAVAAELSTSIFLSYAQYNVWRVNELSAYLLPPHANWNYFLSYVGVRIFLPIVVAFVSAIFLKYASEFLNRRSGERFFEKEEGWLFALGVFLSGYPGLFIYIPLVLVSGVSLALAYSLLKKGRAPLFYLWLPVAVFAILVKSFVPLSILNMFVI